MEISDPKTIRALAHPLRLDLLQVLGASGPATAAHCARVLGASQASCSFHLRQLAKYGLVEEAGPSPDKRERRWRVTHVRLTVRIDADGAAGGRDSLVQQEIDRVAIEHAMQAILDYSQRPDGASSRWRHKAGIVATMALLSPDEVAEIKEKWFALLAPYVARAHADGARPQPGQHHVRYFMAATPLPDPVPDPKESNE